MERNHFVIGPNGLTMTPGDMWRYGNSATKQDVSEAGRRWRDIGQDTLTNAGLAVMDGYHAQARAMDWLRRHPRIATVAGLAIGAAYYLGRAGDGINIAHAQDATGNLDCAQIDSVVGGNGEQVVHTYTAGDLDPSRTLQCVGPSEAIEVRVLDCEAVVPGYGELDPLSTVASPVCIDDANTLQPVTNNTLEGIRNALHSMFPQSAPVETAVTPGASADATAVPVSTGGNSFTISNNLKWAGIGGGILGLGTLAVGFKRLVNNWFESIRANNVAKAEEKFAKKTERANRR